ncbi:MAG: hypothetical protein ACK5LS_02055 [Propioniciclava sp.]
MSRPLTLAFVCTANICRSAYADVRARSLLDGEGADLTIDSAGIHGLTGSPIDPEMGRQALARGAEIAGFTAASVSNAFVRDADLVLTAEGGHRQFILDAWPAAFGTVYTFAQFAEALDRVDPALTGPDLLKAVARHRPAARPAGDIPDPYRRGPAAAQNCADTIDAYLATVLPRLTGSDILPPPRT